jgi:3-oxoacyl-[acyl-carrier-protein] synthase II
MSQQKRIVVTGMGAITAVGNNVPETWSAIKAGHSNMGPISRFDTTDYIVKVAGEIKNFDAAACIGHKEARRLDRFSHLAIFSAMEALAHANYTITKENTFNTGVMIGAGFGGAQTLQDAMDIMHTEGVKRVKPFAFPAVLSNMGAASVAMHFGIRGINFNVAAACATVSIGEGAEVIRRGDADVVLAGGSEAEIVPFVLAGLNAMRAMTGRYENPNEASRPFDATRDGFVPSEAAAVLVLESLEHAQARGATIHGELVGYANTCDAYHVSAPDEENTSVVHAMRTALKKAGIAPQEIDYINAHGTSTVLNDLQETRAIKKVFGQDAYKVPVSSTKSMLGHAMSASGALEAIFSLLAIQDSILPPTINLHNPDPECDLDYVPNVARPAELRYVMSNSFGFGGQNAILIFKKWEGQ